MGLRSDDEIAETLVALYSGFLQATGLGLTEASEMARSLVERAKRDARESGDDQILPGAGDRTLMDEKVDPEVSVVLKSLREEGVRDEDFRNYWNLHYLERETATIYDQVTMLAMAEEFSRQGRKDPVGEAMKSLPVYGNHLAEGFPEKDDRPLPYELKSRINDWMILNQARGQQFMSDIRKHSSLNAMIRDQIRRGSL